MITDKIKALFEFIEFLHTNLENFKNYDVTGELHDLRKRRTELKKIENYKAKLELNEVQAEIEKKVKVITDNITNPIKDKAIELSICDWGYDGKLNSCIDDIEHLKNDFIDADVAEVVKHKALYIEYREKTQNDYFTGYLFSDLDEELKDLFDYFKNTDRNEFEAFEKKLISVNSIQELVDYVSFDDNVIDNKTSENSKADLYEASIRVTRYADQEFINAYPEAFKKLKEYTVIKKFREYTVIPNAKNRDELLERFEKLYSQRALESIISLFYQKFGDINEKILRSKLLEIDKFIEEANELSLDIAFNNEYPHSNYYEYLRLDNGYYKNKHKKLHSFCSEYFNPCAASVYARYFLFKDWLKEKLELTKEDENGLNQYENATSQPIDESLSRTKKVIADTFENMDKKGWEYAFHSEHDYNLFTDLLTNFFEYKEYSMPVTPLQLKRACKTKVAKALGEIHRELSNENKLTTDNEYFKLVRVLSHFESKNQNDLYKALTR